MMLWDILMNSFLILGIALVWLLITVIVYAIIDTIRNSKKK